MIEDIKEDYVSFEIAKLLKEKGFNIPTNDYYRATGSGIFWAKKLDWNNDIENETVGGMTYCSCPAQALVIKWLRVKYNIIVETLIFDRGFLEKDKFCFQWRVYDNTEEWETEMKEYKTPEEATEQAILYSLQNLIK